MKMKKVLSMLLVFLLILSCGISSDDARAASGTWRSDAGGWWYEYSDGSYAKNTWLEIDGSWYYFKSSGYMAYSEYIQGCWLNADGSWDTSSSGGHWVKQADNWWYTDNSGWYPVLQWLWIDGKCYFFNYFGYIYKNTEVYGNWVGADGAWNPDIPNLNTTTKTEFCLKILSGWWTTWRQSGDDQQYIKFTKSGMEYYTKNKDGSYKLQFTRVVDYNIWEENVFVNLINKKGEVSGQYRLNEYDDLACYDDKGNYSGSGSLVRVE